jgi:hypothetical protein
MVALGSVATTVGVSKDGTRVFVVVGSAAGRGVHVAPAVLLRDNAVVIWLKTDV